MPFYITFPRNQEGYAVKVIDGKILAAGHGTPGQARRLFGRLLRVPEGGTPADAVPLLVGYPVRSDTHNGKHYWVIIFDFGGIDIDADATYTIQLYRVTGVNSFLEDTLPDLKLETVRLADLQNGKKGEVKKGGRKRGDAKQGDGAHDAEGDDGAQVRRAVSIVYPADQSTISRFSPSAYGMAPGESVAADGGDLAGEKSAAGQSHPNGFWWVSFNDQPVGNAKKLTVTSNIPNSDDITVNLN